MLDVLDKLVEALVRLLKYKKQRNAQFFVEFVVPAFNDFEAVHEAYLSSFASYREMLQQSLDFDEQHPVIAKISEDILLCGSRRQKLHAALTEIDRWESDQLAPFVTAILAYLHWERVAAHEVYREERATDRLLLPLTRKARAVHVMMKGLRGNIPRELTKYALIAIARGELLDQDQPKSDWAMAVIDEALATVNYAFACVCTEYSRLDLLLRSG
jgi:hypothetical protein